LIEYPGNVSERYEYDAYGNCYVLEPNFTPDPDGKSDFDNPYYFQGKRLDLLDNGGLELMSWPYRNYSTYLGRWLQAEKLGMIPNDSEINPYDPRGQYKGSLNLYGAFSSNPAVIIDQYGLESKSCCPKNTCDRWYFWLFDVTSIGFGWAVTRVRAEVHPDPWAVAEGRCCFDKWPAKKLYKYVGWYGGGIGLKASFTASETLKEVQTKKCVRQSDWAGRGSVVSIGVGAVIAGWSGVSIKTPVAQFQMKGFWDGWGIDGSIVFTGGQWYFKSVK